LIIIFSSLKYTRCVLTSSIGTHSVIFNKSLNIFNRMYFAAGTIIFFYFYFIDTTLLPIVYCVIEFMVGRCLPAIRIVYKAISKLQHCSVQQHRNRDTGILRCVRRSNSVFIVPFSRGNFIPYCPHYTGAELFSKGRAGPSLTIYTIFYYRQPHCTKFTSRLLL